MGGRRLDKGARLGQVNITTNYLKEDRAELRQMVALYSISGEIHGGKPDMRYRPRALQLWAA